MKLKVKILDLEAGGFLVAVLNEGLAVLKNINVSDRVSITPKKGRAYTAITDVSTELVGRNEVGVFEDVAKLLKLKEGDLVNVTPITRPLSIDYIKKKLNGVELEQKEVHEIVQDIVDNDLSQVELSAFVTACYTRGLSLKEVYYLTKAVVDTGEKLDIKSRIIVDKHCLGGIPGNRTTMIVIPILASAGLIIPKTSSRSITSPAGTSDTMEVLSRVNLSVNEMKKTVSKTNGCIVWGGSMNLAAADDRLIRVRHPLSLDPVGLMIASIMAKKAAVGATHVLIDIPAGEQAKAKNLGEAKYLARQFEQVGLRMNIKVKTIITDGSQPIGNGVGPVLEARDVLYLLKGDYKRPLDLEEKSLFLAGTIMEFCGNAEKDQGINKAKKLLESGKAYEKMKEIIKAQGGNPDVDPDDLKPGRYSHDVIIKKQGVISHLSNKTISRVARVAGAPTDKTAGIYLYKHLNDKVKKGDVILTIYSKSKRNLNEAVNLLEREELYILR